MQAAEGARAPRAARGSFNKACSIAHLQLHSDLRINTFNYALCSIIYSHLTLTRSYGVTIKLVKYLLLKIYSNFL